MRECPFCTGSIPESAAKCKHCGEWVTADPRPAPATEPPLSPPGKDGVVLLGEAAKTGVTAYIVFAAIGLVFSIIFILAVFVPSWNKAEKQHDRFMNDWEKSRKEQEQRRKEFDEDWNRHRFPEKR